MSAMRWLLALALAALLHAVMFISVELRRDRAGAQAAGEEGLLISLAPAGGDSGAAEPEPQPVEPEPEPDPEPEPKPETEPEVEPEPEPEPDPRVVETEPDPPKPEPEPEPEPVEKAVERTELARQPGSRARAGAGGGTEAASTDGTAGGGDPGARRDYLARIQALLARHKEYPRRARARRIEGIVGVAFTLHQDGRITEARIVDSSGHRLLDDSAREMLATAGPLPPFPEDMAPEPLALEVPIQYSLR